MRSVTIACRGRHFGLAGTDLPLALDQLIPSGGPWEVEIGFGRGRFLLDRAAHQPHRRYLGIEMAARYFRLVDKRTCGRGLDNVVLVLGEALYVLSTVLPRRFAAALHVYFPDPWPKDRHHKRRLFDHDTLDCLLAILEPGGQLFFATDFLDYGQWVSELLGSHPALEVRRLDAWPEGPRTNYEVKYEAEGRPIVRLAVRRLPSAASLLHPGGLEELTVALRPGSGGSSR